MRSIIFENQLLVCVVVYYDLTFLEVLLLYTLYGTL